MQRIKQLKDQLMGVQNPEDVISPVPAPESPDEQYAAMYEKMRAVKSGQAPDQETVELMKRQAANGVYPEGNKYLGTAQPEPEPQVAIAPPVAPVVQQPSPTPTPIQQRPQPTIFQKPQNTNMGYIRPEHEKFLEGNVFPITDAEGFPRELAAGQWAGEGGRKMENPNNNLFGIGPNMKFADLPSNVKTYVKTVKKLLKQRGIEDPTGMTGEEILSIIQDERGQRYEGHNPDPTEYTRFIPSIPEYRYYANKKK